MSGPAHALATVVKVLRSEGLRAARDRILDQRVERRRLRSMRRITEPVESELGYSTVLNLSPLAPYPRRGGSQIQMLDRLKEESTLRTTALLYPVGDSWRLERCREGRSEIVEIPTAAAAGRSSLETVVETVARTTRITGAAAVHIENSFGFPLELVPALRDRGLEVVLSVHDFGCFCSRPHLIEMPRGVFCSFSQDEKRCSGCLSYEEGATSGTLVEHRTAGEAALNAAKLVVFPSEFHHKKHLELFPKAMDKGHGVVINPATRVADPMDSATGGSAHLALVGGIKLHKGGALVAGLVDRLSTSLPDLRVTVFGDGEADLLRPLRQRRAVTIRGYYRAGELPRLLRRAGATVAALPSIWPESYGLVVDECLIAGVPVAAFDLGAVGHRLRQLGIGALANPESGAAGLAEAVVAAAAAGPVSPKLSDHLPTPAGVARRFCDLYADLFP